MTPKDVAILVLTLVVMAAVSILFSFLFTAALDQLIKTDFLKNTFGIDVDLTDGLKPAEYMPAIWAMVALWLFFALMRIVHHNVDFVMGTVMTSLPKEVKKVLNMGGYKE
ncbi:MAG: hypothetical protein CMM25_01835 [Rhodospirillaceae bacterium]|nr:hypothetical protein [Rhodospirillaceae bacterium]|tara:strand:+ start:335 stop:664 length:330 start_codon:yes stop_codon:yes gene_type:complete